MKEWIIVNDNDGNDSFSARAEDLVGAMEQALTELGWWVATPEELEDIEKES